MTDDIALAVQRISAALKTPEGQQSLRDSEERARVFSEDLRRKRTPRQYHLYSPSDSWRWQRCYK